MRGQPQDTDVRIAVPTDGDVLAAHFGRCQQFTLFDVRDSMVVYLSRLQPPAHEPGVIPQWLSQQGAKTVIAGGMGVRAQQLFNQYGIEVVLGATSNDPQDVVERYLAGTLQTGENICDSPGHGPGGGHGKCGNREGSRSGDGHGSGTGGCGEHKD
jgi:predicted Fe-Mo cluster-binding NifX family protein